MAGGITKFSALRGNTGLNAAPAEPSLVLAPGSDSGVAEDGITSDSTPTLNGVADPGATIRIYDGATLLGDVIVGGGGTWTYTTAVLADGLHSLTAVATDGVDDSTPSEALALTVDTQAPTVTIGVASPNASNQTQVTFTFSEAPVGFDLGDIVATNGAMSNLSATGDPKVFTARFTKNPGSADGSVAVTAGGYTDAAVNFGGAGAAQVIQAYVAPSDPEAPPPGADVQIINGAKVTTYERTSDGQREQVMAVEIVNPETPGEVAVTMGGVDISGLLRGGMGLGMSGPTTPIQPVNGKTPALDYLIAQLTQSIMQMMDGAIADLARQDAARKLPADQPLAFVTVNPIAPSGGRGPDGPLIINAGSSSPTAMLLDATGQNPNLTVHLNGVDFAMVVGALRLGGGEGSQTVWADRAAQYMVLGADDDELHGGGGNDTVGSEGGHDLLFGDAGDDRVFGGDGNDVLQGGLGADTVSGDAGDDVVHGGKDADVLEGGAGADVVLGELGDDRLQGNAGADLLDGGAGADTVHGGQDSDRVFGGEGNDLLLGDRGDDYLQGGLGADTALGGDGADSIQGGKGDDAIVGGAGADWLSGDLGNDTLTGGSEADTFYAFAGGGRDLVTDFDATAGDRVQLAVGTAYNLVQQAGGAVIDLGGGHQVMLAGVQISSLPAGWIFEA